MLKKILVDYGNSYARAMHGLGEFIHNSSEFLKDPKSFKAVLFTGGSDVSPEMYGDTSPKGICHFWKERDYVEFKVAEVAIKYEIPMLGICRGLQLLNVVAGGTLMHDITNHAVGGLHRLETIEGDVFSVNSLHHQMVLPPKDAIVVGWSEERRSKHYIGAADEYVDYDGKEIEAVIYPSIKAFAVQYHPEMMPRDTEGYKYNYKMSKAVLDSWSEFLKDYEEINGRNIKHNSETA